jgi:hypothetical protein
MNRSCYRNVMTVCLYRMTALLAPAPSHTSNGMAAISRPIRALSGAKEFGKTKLPHRTIVIEMSEHFSYDDLAAALSGVRSMHRSSDTIAHADRTPREPARLPGRRGAPGIPRSVRPAAFTTETNI